MPYSWFDCKAEIKNKVQNTIAISQKVMRDNLRGVYLHGSLAMGCFNERKSDLDLMIVASQSLSEEDKLNLARLYQPFCEAPAPLELSIMTEQQINNWRHPSPFEFYCSQEWVTKLVKAVELKSLAPLEYPSGDPDLAAHISVIMERGITLYGKPAEELFQTIPYSDYVSSLTADYEYGKKKVDTKPVYFVLNACRIHVFLTQAKILSKAEGGLWALNSYPANYHGIINWALNSYAASEDQNQPVNKAALGQFMRYMDSIISSSSI